MIWKQVRFNGMSREDAKIVLSLLRALKLRRTPMKQLLDKSLEIALNNTLAIYDSSYIALAMHYNYPLISLDQPQIRGAKAEGVLVIPIENYQP